MLPQINRLTKESDFKIVAKKGRPFYSSCLTIKTFKNNYEASRFGIVISAKASKKAVTRNQLKRRLSEIIRTNLDKLNKGFDVMILVKKELTEKSFKEIEAELLNLFKKAKLL